MRGWPRAPLSPRQQATGINSKGQVVGDYIDSKGYHGFVESNGAFTTISPPGATFSQALGINDSGAIVGYFKDTIGAHGFLYDHGAYTTLNAPGATSTVPAGINNKGVVVGRSDSSQHGFIYDKGTYTPIDVPGNVATGPYAINNSGVVVGEYNDGNGGHGFMTSPTDKPDADGKDALGAVLTSQSSQISMSDLVPGVSMAVGQSGQSMSGSGLDASTGTSFGAFAFPDSAHTAMQVMQVMPSGNG